MPKLLTRKKKTPGPTKKVNYSPPHSPFQRLVDGARLQKGYSFAELARRITPAVNPGSLWIWLHHENGYPHKRSITPERLKSLSSILEIPLPHLKSALDESRQLFGKGESPMPTEIKSAMDQLIDIFENDQRTYISRARVLNLLRRFSSGLNG